MRGACLGRAILVLGGLCFPNIGVASWPDMVSLGPRSAGMAGTGSASADDWEATYQNPAGLADSRSGLALGISYGNLRLNLFRAPSEPRSLFGVQIGASVRLPLGSFLKDRVGIGLGLHLPTSVVNQVSVPYAEVPKAALLDGRTEVVSVLVGLGIRLPLGIRVGGGVLALAALVGDIIIRPDGTGRITSISEEQLTVDYAPIVGARWASKTETWAAGLTFRGASRSSYLLRLHTELGDALPLGLPVISFAGIAQYDPLQLAGETSVRVTEGLRLSVQLVYKKWSDFRYPIEKATKDSVDVPSPNFHDTVVPRLGLEQVWKVRETWEVVARGGYFFEMSPASGAPKDETVKNLEDAHRHVVCAGFGVRLLSKMPLSVSGFFQAHMLQPTERLSGLWLVGGATLGVGL